MLATTALLQEHQLSCRALLLLARLATRYPGALRLVAPNLGNIPTSTTRQPRLKPRHKHLLTLPLLLLLLLLALLVRGARMHSVRTDMRTKHQRPV
jgi:hypothetical protein